MGNKLQHIGVNYVVPKSTLSDGKKSSELLGQISQGLHQH